MTGWWVALGVWYAGLVYVGMWNHRARPTWRRLDVYPLRLRVSLFTPFARRWRAGLAAEDLGWAGAFRRALLWRAAWVTLPPLLIFGWLYGTTWVRYERALARRAFFEARIPELLEIQRRRDFPNAEPDPRAPGFLHAPEAAPGPAAPDAAMGHPRAR